MINDDILTCGHTIKSLLYLIMEVSIHQLLKILVDLLVEDGM